MNDPYKTLNVSPDATDEEIRKAYRILARKYHPDNYAESDLADLAEEKMKEINEAYDRIQKERSEKGTRGGYGAYGTSGQSNASGAANLARVRTLIAAGRYSEASIILDSISQSARNAEWNYLRGCLLLQRGWYHDAQKYFDVACYMDPTNVEYSTARENLRNAAGQYGKTYTRGGFDLGRFCCGLACADCLCDCCGGDLLHCC